MFVSVLHRMCTQEETFLMFINMNTGECFLFIIIHLLLQPFHFRSSFTRHRVVWKIELSCAKHLLFVVFVFIFTIFYFFKEIYYCVTLICSLEKNCLCIYLFQPFSTLQWSVKMSQLHVFSFTGNSFKIPKTTYEKYVNKKWDEQMSQFEMRQTFSKRNLSKWKTSTQEDREQFLITPAPENLKHRSIKFHFSMVSQTDSKETKEVEKPVPESAPFLELLFIQKMLLLLFMISLHFLMIKKSCLSRKQWTRWDFQTLQTFLQIISKVIRSFRTCLRLSDIGRNFTP